MALLWPKLWGARRWSVNTPSILAWSCPLPDWFLLHFLRYRAYRKQVEGGTYAHRNDRPATRTLHRYPLTLADGIISAFVGFEICSQLLHIGVTVFLRYYGPLVEYHCLIPLHRNLFTSVCFSSWDVSLAESSDDYIILDYLNMVLYKLTRLFNLSYIIAINKLHKFAEIIDWALLLGKVALFCWWFLRNR